METAYIFCSSLTFNSTIKSLSHSSQIEGSIIEVSIRGSKFNFQWLHSRILINPCFLPEKKIIFSSSSHWLHRFCMKIWATVGKRLVFRVSDNNRTTSRPTKAGRRELSSNPCHTGPTAYMQIWAWNRYKIWKQNQVYGFGQSWLGTFYCIHWAGYSLRVHEQTLLYFRVIYFSIQHFRIQKVSRHFGICSIDGSCPDSYSWFLLPKQISASKECSTFVEIFIIMMG